MRNSLLLWRGWAPLLAAMLLAGCVAEAPTPELVDPTGFVTYVHPTGVFALSMPPDWVVSDTSDDHALDVAFSPPDAPDPLISVYVTSAIAFLQAQPDTSDTAVSPGNLDALADVYLKTFYTLTDSTLKVISRDPQPDGSLRIGFLIDAPQGTSQHNDFIQTVGPYFVALRTLLPADHAQLRTLSRVITTLNVSTLTGWASAVATPQSHVDATPSLVDFASLNAWVDRNGGFVIVGQVLNRADQPLEFIRITAQLVDANNQVMIEQDDFVSSDLLMPGEYAPFSIVFSDGLPTGTVRYVLEASARYADMANQTFYGPQNFTLSSQADFDQNGLLVISGQVRNEGNLTANLVKVIVTIFDDQQRVIATDTTLVDTQKLAPTDVSTFKVTFFELGGTPNTFLVTAQGIIAGQ